MDLLHLSSNLGWFVLVDFSDISNSEFGNL